MTNLDSLYDYFTNSGIINSLTYQQGSFREGNDEGYFVIIPDGGGNARPWIRMPRYRIYLFGGKAASEYGLPSTIGVIASNLVEYIRDNEESGNVVYMEITEPQILKRTDSNRPALQMTLTVKS